MATNITEWIPRIAPAVPLCPKQVIEEAIINTCRDFCQLTQLWDNNALTAIDIVDGTSDYDLTSASGDIVGIDAVEVDDTPISPTTVEELDRKNSLWRQTVTERSSWYIVGMADCTFPTNYYNFHFFSFVFLSITTLTVFA